MAMFAPIPLPDSGNQVFKDVMDYFETLQRRNSQQQQFAQQLKLSKQAEARAQELLPFQIQQYKDTHNREASDFEIQQMYHGLIKDALKNGMNAGTGMPSFGGTPSPVPGALPGGSPDTAQGQPVSQPSADEVNLAKNASFPALPMAGDLNAMVQQAPVTPPQIPPNAAAMPAPAAMPIAPGAAIPPPQVNPQAPLGSATQGAAPMAAPPAGNLGQEIVLRQGNPALSKLDAVAGFVPGIPKPVTHFGANGQIYTQYPSGKVTMQQSAVPGMKTVAQETPEERQMRETNTYEAKQESKAHVTQNMGIENTNRDLTLMYKQADEAEKLLKSDPYLTGVGWKIPLAKAAAGSKKLGDLQSLFGKLQGQLSKLNASRPGIGTIQWAANVKPDTGNNTEYNLGMIRDLKKQIRDQIDSDNEIYYRNKKTKLPHPDDNEMITLTNPDTKEKMKLTKKEARERGADV